MRQAPLPGRKPPGHHSLLRRPAVHSEISAGLPSPRQQRQFSRPTPLPESAKVDFAYLYARHQHALHAARLHREALSLYAQGKRKEAMALNDQATEIAHPPRAYRSVHPASRFNKIVSGTVGRHGLLGAAEDLAQSVNPVALERTVAKRIQHPLRKDKGLSAGMVVGGPGGFRVPRSVGDIREIEASLPKPEIPKAGAAAEQTLLTPAEQVAKSLGPARRLAAEQKRLYRAERSARVGRGQAAMEAAGGGRAGFEAAMREQRGELPKTTFNRLREGKLGTADVEQLIRHAQAHPDLQFWQKQTVTKALLDAFEHGRTPRPHEIKLLQTAFGQDATAAISKASVLTRAGRLAVDVLGIPRSLMASVDVSAPFRQGLVAGARHPAIFFRNFKHMFKALGSERAYQAILDDIHSRPNAPLYEEAGVKFTELGRELTQREEAFPGALAERVPGVGRVVHASGRAYTGFLDKMRADMFDRQLELARKAGVNVEDRKQLRGIARLVNSATGRGDLGPVESWAPALNTIFFSPRLIASRVNLLNPVWYATMPKYARHQALRSMVQLGGAAGLVLGASAYFGGKVGTDPRSADFAKLRIGNTRADVLGGFQQYVRLGTQLATGKVVSSTTGKTMTLGPGFGDLNREDIAKRFIAGKFSPPASFVDDFFKGTTFAGQPFSVRKEILARVVPLVVQDSYDLYKNTDSVPAALLGYSISAFGIGMQTYGPVKKKPKGHGAGRTRESSLLRGGGNRNHSSLLRRGGSSGGSSLLRR